MVFVFWTWHAYIQIYCQHWSRPYYWLPHFPLPNPVRHYNQPTAKWTYVTFISPGYATLFRASILLNNKWVHIPSCSSSSCSSILRNNLKSMSSASSFQKQNIFLLPYILLFRKNLLFCMPILAKKYKPKLVAWRELSQFCDGTEYILVLKRILIQITIFVIYTMSCKLCTTEFLPGLWSQCPCEPQPTKST